MSETSRHTSDITTHPDAMEMRERFAQIAEGPRGSAVDGLIVLLGMYTAISPWVVHFRLGNADVTVNNLIIGLTLAILGLGMALQPARLYQLGWICVPVGVWMIISPWVVTNGHSAPSSIIWNNLWIGVAAILLGLATQGMMFGVGRRSRHSRH
jgi:hypothetical protein